MTIMCACVRLPWSWSDVTGASQTVDPVVQCTITTLDRKFAAKDTQVLYFVSGTLLAMIWALIISMYAVHDLDKSKNAVVAIFCLAMDVIAFLYAVRRIWIIKFLMVHPALGMLGQMQGSNPVASAVTTVGTQYDFLLRRESGVPMTNVFLGMMVACQAIAVVSLSAAAACLVGSDTTVVAAGIGLAAACSVAFVVSVVFYRKHAGVHLQQVQAKIDAVAASRP
jgi:hypothetical protein